MYDEHFGLSARPFQLTPDPAFWYETATHRRAMAYLGYGLSQGEGFIVITGDIGAGKTTLMGHLIDTLDREALNPIKIVSTAIDAADLLRIVAGGLGVDPAGLAKAQLLVAIERGLHAVARTGRRTLLVVDEAQALPTAALEELRMLSNFQAGGHALLQIVLLGQPEFRAALHGSTGLEQLRQRVIAIHHLEPMAADEVAPYLRHRLTVAGWTGRPGFADDSVAAFYRHSGGVPRRLNQLASRVMLHAAVETLDLVTAATVELVAADLFTDLPTVPVHASVDEPGVLLDVAAVPKFGDDTAPLLREAVMDAPVALVFEPEPAAVVPAPEPSIDDVPVEPDQLSLLEAPASEPAVARPPRPFRHSWLEPAMADDHAPDPVVPIAADPPVAADPAMADRIAMLEARVEEQDAALRRVLTLMVDWMDGDGAAKVDERSSASPAPLGYVPIRGAAA